MNTFLFAWNPIKWHWEDLEESIEKLNTEGKYSQIWSCASHRQVKVGDRAFLVKLGKKPTGIIGSGHVATLPFLSKHYSGKDKLVHRVMIDFDVLLNPDKDQILTTELLNQGSLDAQHWSPEQSGISIRQELTDELEAVWFDFLMTQNIRFKPFELSEGADEYLLEGGQKQFNITRYERNPHARRLCIEHYGTSCVVCGVNFEAKYGAIAKDFIHVHHLEQLAVKKSEYSVDPINDLRPVCPNCHSVVHMATPPLSIDRIQELLKTQEKN